MRKLIFTIILLFINNGSLFAAKGHSHPKPKYGAAGCGLGALIFGAKPGMIQIVSATFNSTFANQTFGITSGTSNCAVKKKKSATAKVFIEANKIALQNDSARGFGEALDSLLEIYSCSDSIKPAIQSNYKTIFSNTDADAIEKAISAVLSASNCKV